jgi:transcriptional regulator with XRE-family HTH domain
MSVIGSRLKVGRLELDISQEQLGLLAGLEVESASARMNRYERGTRVPNVELLEKIGAILNRPVTFFYAATDDEAELLTCSTP